MRQEPINAIRSHLTFGILYVYTAAGVMMALILTFLNLSKKTDKISNLWARSVFAIMGKKFITKGIENISPGSKYILIANHGSLFDIVAIMALYPGISWFGHERLLRVPLLGMLLKMNSYIPFREPTYRNTRSMLKQLVSTAADRSIAIFPEGTRTLDGKINDFYRGFIYLLRNNESDILPVTLNGFYDLKPKNRAQINFNAKLEIIIHKPVKRDYLIQKTDMEIIETVKTIIESAYKNNVNQTTADR